MKYKISTNVSLGHINELNSPNAHTMAMNKVIDLKSCKNIIMLAQGSKDFVVLTTFWKKLIWKWKQKEHRVSLY